MKINRIIHLLKILFISIFFTFALSAYSLINNYREIPSISKIIIIVLLVILLWIFFKIWASFENLDVVIIKIFFSKFISFIICFSILIILEEDINYYPNEHEKNYLLISESIYGENEDGDEHYDHGYGYILEIDKLRDTVKIDNQVFLVYNDSNPKFLEQIDDNITEDITERYLINNSITKEYGLFLGYKFLSKEKNKWYQYLYYLNFYLFEFLLNNWFTIFFSLLVYFFEDKINLLKALGVFNNLKNR